jgi:hypothetical protein
VFSANISFAFPPKFRFFEIEKSEVGGARAFETMLVLSAAQQKKDKKEALHIAVQLLVRLRPHLPRRSKLRFIRFRITAKAQSLCCFSSFPISHCDLLGALFLGRGDALDQAKFDLLRCIFWRFFRRHLQITV